MLRSISLLERLISIPSQSKHEEEAADALEAWLDADLLEPRRRGNNLWCRHGMDTSKPTLLLNAHIDTVKPNPGYTRDPYSPVLEKDEKTGEERLYGLGSNDDGGSLIALLETYRLLSLKPQPYNLVFTATAEEEISGREGIERILPDLGPIKLGIIGEPTGMDMAVAERGLMVLDCKVFGRSGHAARNEGINAIYEAIPDIIWFKTHKFSRISDHLGPVKMTVTQINAGIQHNIVPDRCEFVVDVRPNGMYRNEELLGMIKNSVSCSVKERSTRLESSSIPMDHPVVKRGLSLGLKPFGSPTTSNCSVTPFTTLKIGPGDSSRSHSADEYILPSEIEHGIEVYMKLLDGLEI